MSHEKPFGRVAIVLLVVVLSWGLLFQPVRLGLWLRQASSR